MLGKEIGSRHNPAAGYKAVSDYISDLRSRKLAEQKEAEEKKRLEKEAAEIEKKIADLKRRMGR